jgi:hypothetical protein
MMDGGEGIELFMAARIRGHSEFELPPLWVDRADERLHTLKIYASPRVSDLADKARTAYRKLVMTVREMESDISVGNSHSLEEDVDEWNATADELRAAIRKDLGVPSE